MKEDPYALGENPRRTVLEAIQSVCDHRGWMLEACHVRTTHVHVVVTSEADPERVMNDFKSYSSRALNELGECREKRWARHGSIKRIASERLMQVVRYVLEGQGEPMAVWPRPRDRQSSR